VGVQEQGGHPRTAADQLHRLAPEELGQLHRRAHALRDAQQLHGALREPWVGAAAEGLVGRRGGSRQPDDRLQLHRHGALRQQLLELSSASYELVREGRRVEGGGRRAIFALFVRGVPPADAELEVAEVQDVSVLEVGLRDDPMVHVGPVSALQVTNPQRAVPFEDLGVPLGDPVGRQHELEARLAADAEGQGLDPHPPELSSALGDAFQDPPLPRRLHFGG